MGAPNALGKGPQPFSRDSSDDRTTLVCFILHAADLSNPVSPPARSKRVAETLSLEFNAQAQRERERGLPVTVMVASDAHTKAKLEAGFIDAVVRPTYDLLCLVAPQLEPSLQMMNDTREMWEHELNNAAGAP